ncbi:MAG: NUDIX hydrolase [Oscillospiraceae bacterium]|nr:NUDIX hydrolase [Oscillospiraceae bacterium]
MDSISFSPVSDTLLHTATHLTLALHWRGEWLLRRETDGWAFLSAEAKPGFLLQASDMLLGSVSEDKPALQAVTAYAQDGSAGILFYAALADSASCPGTLSPFSVLPGNLARPDLEPLLYQRVQWHLNSISSPDERWDVYDAARRRTGRTMRRADPIAPGDYHLVVHCWLQRPDGTYLLTQRAPNKGYPLLWECTGGSALAGENSLEAVVREIREETGLLVNPACARLGHTIQRDSHFLDLWHICQAWDLSQLHLQPGETVDARWVSMEELLKLRDSGELVPYDYFDELLSIGFFSSPRA